MAQKPPSPEEVRLAETIKLNEGWKIVRQFIQFALGTAPITQEHEQNFLRVKTDVSKLQRALSQKMPPGLILETQILTDLLKRLYSLEDIRNQEEKDRAGFTDAWHKVNLSLGEIVGALQYMQQGYVYNPSTRVKADDKRRGAKKKADDKKKKVITTIIALALLGIAIWFLTNR